MIISLTITSIRTIIYIFYYYWSKPRDPSGGVSIRSSANAWELWTWTSKCHVKLHEHHKRFFQITNNQTKFTYISQIPYNYFFWTISFAPHATYNYFFWIISFASHATYNYFFWTISCATHSTYNYFFWIISIATHATYNYFFCTNLLQNKRHIYIYIHTPLTDRSLKDKAKIKLLGMSIIARNSKHW